MKWNEIKIEFEAENIDLAQELVASLLYDFGAKGLVIEGPDDFLCEAQEETLKKNPHAVIAHFSDLWKGGDVAALEWGLAGLKEREGIQSRLFVGEMDEEDWAHLWKDYFWPEHIGGPFVVKPTWRDYEAAPHEKVIEIDPGMAFGTGTHPTTSMCVDLMSRHFRDRDRFMDAGTGSGILMVVAARLGARLGAGLDNDDIAVEAAQKNIRVNGLDEHLFSVKNRDLTGGVDARFDFVAANILGPVVMVLMDDIRRVLAKKGRLVCSGFVERDKGMILEKMTGTGFRIIETKIKESWVAICGEMV